MNNKLVKLDRADRYLVAIFFLLAFIVRLIFNLYTNPMGLSLYSDMAGYNQRADLILNNPFVNFTNIGFYPIGTDLIIAWLKYLFGVDNFKMISVIYAVFGAGSVALAYSIARMVSKFYWVPIIVGIIGIININQIILSSYLLSQTPFCFFMLLTIWFLIKYIATQNLIYGCYFSLFISISALIRPEILIFIFLLFIVLIIQAVRKNSINFKNIFYIICFLLVFLGLSSGLYNLHASKPGFLASNGSLNLVFGRCHNAHLLPKQGKWFFGVPPLIQANKSANAPFLLQLEPAFKDIIYLEGSFDNSKVHYKLVKDCIKKTGILKQAKYSITNVLLLWYYELWPAFESDTLADMSSIWSKIFRFCFMLASFLGVIYFLILNRNNSKISILAVNYLGILIVSAIIFGSIRIRTPYDFIIIIIALEFYFIFGEKLLAKIRKLRNLN